MTLGLTESVGTNEYYRQNKLATIKLPVRWLAPESLEDYIFSEKSDVVRCSHPTPQTHAQIYTFLHTNWSRHGAQLLQALSNKLLVLKGMNMRLCVVQVMLIKLLALHSCSMQWAYGVTCWEVFTAGKVPYATVNLNNILTKLNNGHRLEKPANNACDEEM